MKTTVATIEKNASEKILVGIDEYGGHDLASVRVWYTHSSGELRPTKAGVAFKVSLLPALHDAIGDAIAQARAAGLIQ